MIASAALFALISVITGLVAVTIPVICRAIIRKSWAALPVTWLLFASAPMLNADITNDPIAALITVALSIVKGTVFFVLVLRFGLLTTAAALYAIHILESLPGSIHLGQWYSQPLLTGVCVLGALGVTGFVTALAGRRVFRDDGGA